MPRRAFNNTGDPAHDSCDRCGHKRMTHKDGCKGLHYDAIAGTTRPCTCKSFLEQRDRKQTANKVVTLHLQWHGDVRPELGEFLMSPQRAKWAYRIVDIHVPRTRGSLEMHEYETLQISAERVSIPTVPKGAKIHALAWSDRGPKRDRRVKAGAA